MKDAVVKKLEELKLTIASAESCTGGLFIAELINVSGASNVVNESIITYSNDAKIKYCDVNPVTLKIKGAVSEECALEMAIGIKNQAEANIGVSITGIAGPTGGTKEKPVGLVFIGIAYKKVKVYKHIFTGDRFTIRKKSVQAAINHVLEELENDI